VAVEADAMTKMEEAWQSSVQAVVFEYQENSQLKEWW
jgi:hypothetical protein